MASLGLDLMVLTIAALDAAGSASLALGWLAALPFRAVAWLCFTAAQRLTFGPRR